MLAHFWNLWGADRPPHDVCLDELVLHNGFVEATAHRFLKVYDDKYDVSQAQAEIQENQKREHSPTAPRVTQIAAQLATEAAEGWEEEHLIDDDGELIKIRYRGKPTQRRYEFIRDYLAFKIGRMKGSKSGQN